MLTAGTQTYPEVDSAVHRIIVARHWSCVVPFPSGSMITTARDNDIGVVNGCD